MPNLSNRFYEFAIGITLFLQIVFPKIMPIGIILLSLSVIYLGFSKEVKFVATKTHFYLIAFYATYLIGVFFTNNPNEASHVLESKLSFLIFPLLFFIIPKKKINLLLPISLSNLGLMIAFFHGVFNGFQCYSTTKNLSCFISTPFSPIHHPTYMAIYYLTGILLTYYALNNKVKLFNLKTVIISIVVFSIGYILCMSLSAILFLGLLIAVIGLKWFNKRYGLFKSIGIVVIILTGFIGIIQLSKDTVSDVSYTLSSVKTYLKSPGNFVKNANRYLVGNEERLVLWTISTQAIIERPIGYGTGNIDDVIGDKLRSYELHSLAEKQFNPHNQYLQTFIEIGIVGFLLLILIFISIIQVAWRTKNHLLLIVASSFAFNSLFESVFQRQSGIVFFSIIIFLLLLHFVPSNKKSIVQS